MKAEELFLAIGEVESSRLTRSELTTARPSGQREQEEPKMTEEKNFTLKCGKMHRINKKCGKVLYFRRKKAVIFYLTAIFTCAMINKKKM